MSDDPEFCRSLYFDRTFNTMAVRLLPGQFHATSGDTMLVTVLGSCVAVCLRDPLLNIGGMNHFMLPAPGPDSGNSALSARYGDHAISILVEHIVRLGGRPSQLEAKVFGGGRVIDAMTDVGQNNVNFAREQLRRLGIQVTAEDVGDVHPRKVYFSPATGRVHVRRLRSDALGQAGTVPQTLEDLLLLLQKPLDR